MKAATKIQKRKWPYQDSLKRGKVAKLAILNTASPASRKYGILISVIKEVIKFYKQGIAVKQITTVLIL